MSGRLISIAAGVTPELGTDPAAFVRAAGAAGWPATGVWFDPATWSSHTTREVKTAVDDAGLAVVDLEVIRMGPGGDQGPQLIEAAGELGAANVLAISTYDDPAQTAHRFAELCQVAKPAGVAVCLEFMRFTQVKDLGDAVKILAMADQPNGGILVDLLHLVRSGTSFADIEAVDPGLFPYAQWCDGAAEPRGWDTQQIISDALDDRTVPGHGDLDAAGFESLFADTVPFSLEVRSRRLREAFPDPLERASYLLRETRAAMGT